jgi:hypothetical protein
MADWTNVNNIYVCQYSSGNATSSILISQNMSLMTLSLDR